MTLTYTPTGFALDGRDFRVLSGAAHYFRSLPEQWPALMRSLRAMGLNTVETYLAWNFHERSEGQWTDLDLIERFLDAAAGEGLRTIVRPGPYICAEWDNGGMPSWLTGRVGRSMRTSAPEFTEPVMRYLDAVVPRFAQHPSLLMVQIENEYGSYGNDATYLGMLADALVERGVTVPLFTSDGPGDVTLTGGTVPGKLATVNFGSQAATGFAALRRIRPDSAPFCMEYWCGWFDRWGHPRVTRDAADAAVSLREILDEGGSVNLYMAHGGTSFGTGAGANHHSENGEEGYRPTITSYDYDAPLDERGAPTEKFHAFRSVLAGHAEAALPELPDLPPLVATQSITPTRSAPVAYVPQGSAPVPPTFEELGLDHGLVRYSTSIPGPREPQELRLEGLRDRAHVRVDGELRAIIDRTGVPTVADVAGPAELEVIVESMGRINYGVRLGETKGIDAIRHGWQQLNGFRVETLALPGAPAPVWDPAHGADGAARFVGADFQLEAQGDGYLDLSAFSKGYVWVNGFCLGRYWSSQGPQTSLYVPWPVLRAGHNELVILELDGVEGGDLVLGPVPALGVRRTPEAGS